MLIQQLRVFSPTQHVPKSKTSSKITQKVEFFKATIRQQTALSDNEVTQDFVVR
jgi:hypothetical protein